MHDDTEAILSFLDSLSKNGGGTMYLRPGIYMLRSLRLGVKTSIVGSGTGATIIKQMKDCKENCLVVSKNAAALKISDLTILGIDRNAGIYFESSLANYENHPYLYTDDTQKAQPYKWITIDNVCV